mmetsp:Transcript_130204/g.226287  ORF Transcript_130204/g.226287 Transcript_130204/m.226287 type:complete len:240 (-) Transcript_130204:579-1298(-)
MHAAVRSPGQVFISGHERRVVQRIAGVCFFLAGERGTLHSLLFVAGVADQSLRRDKIQTKIKVLAFLGKLEFRLAPLPNGLLLGFLWRQFQALSKLFISVAKAADGSQDHILYWYPLFLAHDGQLEEAVHIFLRQAKRSNSYPEHVFHHWRSHRALQLHGPYEYVVHSFLFVFFYFLSHVEDCETHLLCIDPSTGAAAPPLGAVQALDDILDAVTAPLLTLCCLLASLSAGDAVSARRC